MTFLIIFACVITPLKIAFEVQPSQMSMTTDICVDILFLIDIIIIMNSAFYDERDFKLIQERDEIVRQYVKGWFLIDILAIIPFDLFIGQKNKEGNELARMSNIISLTKLLRVAKIARDRNNIMRYVHKLLKIGIAFQRLIFCLIIFFLFCHVTACIWIM